MKKIFFSLVFSALILSACTEETNTSVIGIEDIESLVSSTIENAEKYDVSKFEEYELQEVIDGDTIRIKYNKRTEKERFLIIDTNKNNNKMAAPKKYVFYL